jgi:hypothetical protein
MANVVKYSLTTQANTLKKGNVVLGINSVEYGPTSATGFWNGIEVPAGGYVMYIPYSNGSGMTIYSMSSNTELIKIVNEIGLQSFTTVAEALAWTGQQTGLFLVNKAAANIVTDGLVLSLDAGFLPSYPATGNTWYNLGSDNTNGTLINGPTWDEDGYFEFDGTDDSVSLANIVQNSNSSTTIEVIMKSNSNIATPDQTQMNFILSGATSGSVDAYNQFTMSTAGTVPLIILKSRVQYTSALSKYSYQVYYQILDIDMNNYPVVVQKYFNPDGSLFSEAINYPQIINQTYSYIWSITNSDSGTRSIKHYLNGQQISVLGGAQTADFNFFNKNNLALGLRSNSNISILRLYNRALTAAEVLQNYYQAPIVTDGLVLALDAGNLVSYESGTTWYNLSANSSNGTLTNGPTFDSGNGGSIVFDGVDDRVTCAPNSITSNSLTFIIWIKRFSFGTQGTGLVFNRGNGGRTTGMNINYPTPSNGLGYHWNDDSNTYTYNPGLAIPLNTWCFCCVSVSPTQAIFQVNNNTVVRSYTNVTANTTVGTNIMIGTDYTINRFVNANVAYASMYNRALSQSEILQNFNAQRARFGI